MLKKQWQTAQQKPTRPYIHNLISSSTNLGRIFKMPKYADGFVLVVPRGKEAEYQKMAYGGFAVAVEG